MSTPAVFEFVSCLRRGAATLIDGTADLDTQRIALDTRLHFNDGHTATEKIELYGPGEITGFDARAVTRTWPGRNVMDADARAFAHIEFDQPDLPWRYTPETISGGATPVLREHVLSFEKIVRERAPRRQRFSNEGAWWEWALDDPPLIINGEADLAGLSVSHVIGVVDFDEPVRSITVTFNWTLQWGGTPTLVLEPFPLGAPAGGTLPAVEIPLVKGVHSKTETITPPTFLPIWRFRIRVVGARPFEERPDALITASLVSITYVAGESVPVDAADRLRPWCVLIVLRPEEILGYRPAASEPGPLAPPPASSAGQPEWSSGGADSLPLPALKTSVDWLPDLAESWRWAHVQISGKTEVLESRLLELFASAPQRMLSRILCPRELEPRVPYRAFLVPAFERGRRAGLGQPNDMTLQGRFTGSVAASLPAWTDATTEREIELPVYYEWAFQLAEGVDFESLARALKPKPLPPDVGARPVDVSEPGAGLPPASTTPLWIEGALKAAAPAHTWNPAQRARFVAALAQLLNTPEAPAPAFYGRWLAARDRVVDTPSAWLDTLNIDPRNRVASGAGAEVVERNEEKIVDGAWRQIEGLPEINEQLRLAQLARAIARRLRERIAHVTGDSYLFLHAPLLRRVKLGTTTIAKLVASSPLARGPFESAFRKLLQRILRRRRLSGTNLVERMNRGEIAAASIPATPSLVTMIAASSGAIPSGPEPFRTAAAAMLQHMLALRVTIPQPVPLDLAGVRQRLAASTDPESAVARLRARLHIAPGFPRAAADPLEPMLATPEFDQPMYEPLRDLSEEWILPGLAAFPANTASLAVVNRPFIEAYVLGLTHALTRVLLWRGYPGDQRGTNFRQFWDPRGYFGPRTRDELRTIPPVDTWPSGNALGDNSSSPPLVLLLRGDLLRVFPTAIVYATRAARVNDRREPLDPPVERHPVFRGRLGGDIAFFGFELTAEEARGDATDEGWFFVLQEQPNEPRFGPAPGMPGPTSAGIAKNTLLPPVRVLLHADRMLVQD